MGRRGNKRDAGEYRASKLERAPTATRGRHEGAMFDEYRANCWPRIRARVPGGGGGDRVSRGWSRLRDCTLTFDRWRRLIAVRLSGGPGDDRADQLARPHDPGLKARSC